MACEGWKGIARKTVRTIWEEVTNGRVPVDVLFATSRLTKRQQQLLQHWSSTYDWSNRVQTKIIRLARTIADLAGTYDITDEAHYGRR
ncbi:hypothetical protein [Anoxybacillus pushchinoensis]|uniref:magnesium chelatase subunit ChlI family protein n=1 Tax=Anoxybacillus pushchinoensis TaxID=150248 RepID=UPI001FCA25CC|nr:hypothetical protein [Anoxybacillus pushchinoensis]